MRLINAKNLLNQKTWTKKKHWLFFTENAKRPLKGRQNVLNGFESKIFPIGKQQQGNRCLGMLARVAKVSDGTGAWDLAYIQAAHISKY